jgi:riboflavin biosynthesis pyrimidine reductase
VELRRLFPDPGVVTIDDLTSDLRFGERAPADRPFVAVNMVSSADGKATLEGRTAPMSAPADRELFHHLRAAADGILVGAGTVRSERYGKVTKTAELEAKRERLGVRKDALAVIVSRSGEFDPELGVLAEAIVVADPQEALPRLRGEGIRSLLCEGGPHLNSTLFGLGLVDELFLTISPTIAGPGESLTIVEGTALPDAVELELLTAHEAGGHLFLRYGVH